MSQHTEQKLSSALQEYGVKALWYLTHIANLSSILNNGILCRNEISQRGIEFKDISDPKVQRWRKKTYDYVPLFFADNTPMLFVCWQKFPNEIILLEIDLRIADTEGVLFSDGNIASQETKIYKNFQDLANLDWKIILDRRGAYGKEWKRKRSAELLVPKRVPQEFICCVHLAISKQFRSITSKLRTCQVTFVSDLTPEGVR